MLALWISLAFFIISLPGSLSQFMFYLTAFLLLFLFFTCLAIIIREVAQYVIDENFSDEEENE